MKENHHLIVFLALLQEEVMTHVVLLADILPEVTVEEAVEVVAVAIVEEAVVAEEVALALEDNKQLPLQDLYTI